MNTLITYDVSRRQPEVKRELKKLGYHDSWSSDNVIYNLPDTTLWKANTEQIQALREMKAVIAKLNHGQAEYNHIRLERCVCVNVNPWAAIPGDKHKE